MKNSMHRIATLAVEQTKQTAQYLMFVACLMLAGSLSAFAASSSQVGRVLTQQSLTDGCVPTDCEGIQPTVSLTEPATVTPVIVTWTADYNTTGSSVVYLSLNGGRCLAYGSYVLQQPLLISGSIGNEVSATYQWVILPSDGLVAGKNTFTLCVGGYGDAAQTVNIFNSTLTVLPQ